MEIGIPERTTSYRVGNGVSRPEAEPAQPAQPAQTDVRRDVRSLALVMQGFRQWLTTQGYHQNFMLFIRVINSRSSIWSQRAQRQHLLA